MRTGMTDVIEQIMDYLERNGNRVTWTDEPYMPFMAERQDWSFARPGLTQLHLAYYQMSKYGDIMFDPLIVLDFQYGAIRHVRIRQFGFAELVETRFEGFVSGLIAEMFNRHFVPRVEA